MVGGCGCGVVVWELYSEREHLADDDEFEGSVLDFLERLSCCLL